MHNQKGAGNRIREAPSFSTYREWSPCPSAAPRGFVGPNSLNCLHNPMRWGVAIIISPGFIDGETEARRSQVSRLGSHC